MKSRYDYMKEGRVTDIDNSFFPDPLSLNYVAFSPQHALDAVDLSTDGVKKFWWVTHQQYGKPTFLDDVILTLNGVVHKNTLKAGQIIYFPAEEDIERSFNGDNNQTI